MEISGAASLAALTIAPPPLAWTVKNFGARSETLFTDDATVLGISCSFRSRNTWNSPASANCLNPAAPNFR